ncbi:hypothetical protein C2845_PM08G17480 [Panicum miliaceum]|uniref:Transposase (putative) gypsy type domain-containing protein n=1 Tax=Panicum miliaceum TaxID=4540 RepID=A0A3L6R3P4_PANMI|nr:hypothetical protein C2845_PM08G17480 [Panicum miliaceum]
MVSRRWGAVSQHHGDQVVSFLDFHTRGLGPLAHKFFLGFLNTFGLELQHLNPNSDPLPRFTGFAPRKTDAWRWGFSNNFLPVIDAVAKVTGDRVGAGLTGAGLVCTFLERRVQPLYHYLERVDPTSEGRRICRPRRRGVKTDEHMLLQQLPARGELVLRSQYNPVQCCGITELQLELKTDSREYRVLIAVPCEDSHQLFRIGSSMD